MDNSTGYVITRVDTDEGVVISEDRFRFPSKHYYDLWIKLYAAQLDHDAVVDLWDRFRVEE